MKTYKIIGEDGKVKDFTPSTNEEQANDDAISKLKNTVAELNVELEKSKAENKPKATISALEKTIKDTEAEILKLSENQTKTD